jgi:hypothetical protein
MCENARYARGKGTVLRRGVQQWEAGCLVEFLMADRNVACGWAGFLLAMLCQSEAPAAPAQIYKRAKRLLRLHFFFFPLHIIRHHMQSKGTSCSASAVAGRPAAITFLAPPFSGQAEWTT